MKVGDYVRNKYGIAKVIDIENNNGIDVLVFDKNICFLVNKKTGEITEDKLLNKLAIIEDIDINKINSSSNIIDLIEVGDYVNGYEVTSKDQFLGFGNYDWYMTNDEIKSIKFEYSLPFFKI